MHPFTYSRVFTVVFTHPVWGHPQQSNMSFGCVNVEDNIIGLYYAISWIYTEHNFLLVDLEFIKSDWTRSPLHNPWFGYPPPLDDAQTPLRPWLRSQPAAFGVPLPRQFYQLTCARCDRRGYFRSISFFEIRFIWNVHPVPLCTAICYNFF